MKTAISVEDSLIAQADQVARDLGVSRSRLVADALREYLKKRRRKQISEQLNKVYGGEASPGELEFIRNMKAKFPPIDPW